MLQKVKIGRFFLLTMATLGSLIILYPIFAHAQRILPPQFSSTDLLIKHDGLEFVDLNHNGSIEPYEDWRLSAEERAKDLVYRMTLAEKMGLMMHGNLPSDQPFGIGTKYDIEAFKKIYLSKHVNSFITRINTSPLDMATQHNELQAIARKSRLSIPVLISTDPRNYYEDAIGISISGDGFSKWPQPLGFAALGDTKLTQQFADIVRQEYRAVGITMALSPQADIASEPRWPRISGTFGSDPDLVGEMVAAYVKGIQNNDSKDNTAGSNGVIAIVKHWVGYGAEINGWDGHNFYGRFSAVNNETIDMHISPFQQAFKANVIGVMPTYVILKDIRWHDKPLEEVGAGFNKVLLTNILRQKEGFKGLIISDWGIIDDCDKNCQTGEKVQTPDQVGMPWGVMNLSKEQRVAKAINAGIDQIGGSDDVDLLAKAVQSGLVSEERVNQAALHVLKPMFQIGLFDNPFVDLSKVNSIVGSDAFVKVADATQRQSMVMLENKLGAKLPRKGSRVFLHGVSQNAAQKAGLVPVDSIKKAQFAIFRLQAPYEKLHPNFYAGSGQHEGSLDFKANDKDFKILQKVAEKLPTIVSVYLDRPAILTKIKPLSKILIGEFGATDAALLDVIMGNVKAEGKLPFDLPRDMKSVTHHPPSVPRITNPLYPLGYQL